MRTRQKDFYNSTRFCRAATSHNVLWVKIDHRKIPRDKASGYRSGLSIKAVIQQTFSRRVWQGNGARNYSTFSRTK
jgi:hypothetical protein